jgi:chromosome partitioning protein
MSFIISITNQKGGVAKTTTSIHLAIGLAQKNKKTLLIDLDPQRNATGVILKTTDFPSDKSIFQVFQTKSVPGNLIYETYIPNLLMIPSSLNLVELENMLAGAVDGFFRLSEALEKLKNEFDFVIIDCPPSLSILTLNALVSATHLIVPLQVSKFSIDGINSLMDVISSIQKRYNVNLKVLGALFQFFDERTTIAKSMYEMISAKLPVFKTKIPKSIVVEESHMLKTNLYSYAPDNKVTKSYTNLVKEVLNAIEKQ